MAPFVTQGFHHVTLVARDARRTVDFYRELLGFDLVKQTVAVDDASTYRLFFGVEGGVPGTLLAVLVRPGAARGAWGIGGIHHVALGVEDEAGQLKWKRRLTDHGVSVTGPYDRGYFTSIYFADPDGQILEIATEGPGFDIDEPLDALGKDLIVPNTNRLPGGRDEAAIAAQTHPEPVPTITPDMTLHGIHHVTGFTDDLVAADDFYHRALGMRLVKRSMNQDDPDTLHYFWANYDGTRVLPASDMTLFGWPKHARRARAGSGQLHHVAYRAESDEQQLAWRDHLLGLGLDVSPVHDHGYYKSVAFRTPDGLLVELATDTPGFAIDEDPAQLGKTLVLPASLEPRRAEITAALPALD